MKRYTDLEIADHAIMLENLPRNIPRKYLEKRLKSVFKQICSDFEPSSSLPRHNAILDREPVVQVSVISDYGKCQSMIQDLKLAAGKYQKAAQVN